MESVLEKGQEVLITIRRMGINGEGIGFYKKQAVFVDGVFPPEEVVVNITDIKPGYAIGEKVRIKKKAFYRKSPFCKHYFECGGCQTQHIQYEEQLRLKEDMLKQTLIRYSGLDIDKIKFNEMVGMNIPKGYRHKAQMPVRNTKLGLVTGLYKKGTNDLIPIDDCPIHNQRINQVNKQILEILDKYEIFAFDAKTMRGLLRYIVTRVSSHNQEIQVTLVITIYNQVLKSAAKEIMEIEDVVSVSISKNRDAKNVEIFGDTIELLEGKDTITEAIGDVKYLLRPKSFYQLNPEQAKKLYKIIKSNIDFRTERKLIDAYSGSGAISMYLAKDAEYILGIDANQDSISSALLNKRANNYENLEFEVGNVDEVLKSYYNKNKTTDVIIFDPPRSGLDIKTIDILLRKPVKKIIYVSCNPSTLAKNLKELRKKYDVLSVTPLDMFPQTAHIESVTVLKLR